MRITRPLRTVGLLIPLLTVALAPTTARAIVPPAPAGSPAPGAPAGPVAPLTSLPSAFDIGIDGFGMGIFAGLAGGYLFAREGGLHASDWRPLVAGAGVGALAGGALGLTLGLTSTDPASQGRSYLIMREMNRGGQFGLLAGAIVGGLVALGNNHPEHILLGAAIGTLSGTAAGLLVGSLERNPWAAPRLGPVAMQVGVAPLQDARGALSFGPNLVGRF